MTDRTAPPAAEPRPVAVPAEVEEEQAAVQEARHWHDDGWRARIIKNDDDDGWAVAMTRDGEPEPTLIGPWTMGRDKKNPKPMDKTAFNTLVKTASEFRRRSEQQRQAQLHKHATVDDTAGRIKVTLDIVPDDDFPYAVLTAYDADAEVVAQVQVAANFVLNQASAARWVASGYRKPN